MFGKLIKEFESFSGFIIRTFETDDGTLHEFWFTNKGVELYTGFAPVPKGKSWDEIEAEMVTFG